MNRRLLIAGLSPPETGCRQERKIRDQDTLNLVLEDAYRGSVSSLGEPVALS